MAGRREPPSKGSRGYVVVTVRAGASCVCSGVWLLLISREDRRSSFFPQSDPPGEMSRNKEQHWPTGPSVLPHAHHATKMSCSPVLSERKGFHPRGERDDGRCWCPRGFELEDSLKAVTTVPSSYRWWPSGPTCLWRTHGLTTFGNIELWRSFSSEVTWRCIFAQIGQVLCDWNPLPAD